jgi:hypothetical protein
MYRKRQTLLNAIRGIGGVPRNYGVDVGYQGTARVNKSFSNRVTYHHFYFLSIPLFGPD